MEVRPGYKQTIVGVIPNEWEVRNLAEVSRKITDGDHVTPMRTSHGYYLLSARNVLNGRIDVSDVDYVGAAEYRRMKQRCGPEAGDILISCSGTIGRVSVVPLGFDCVLVRSAALVKIDPDLADGIFLQFWLQGSKAQGQIASSVNQGAQPNLFLNHIERLACPHPPLPEQRTIATALSDVDALLDGLDRLIAKKSDLKQAAMQQLLSGQTRLPGFIGEWEVKRLGDLTDPNQRWSLTGGPFGSNLKSSDYTDEGVRIIQLQNIGDGQFLDDYKIFTSEAKADELISCNIYPGEIILSKMGDPVARACIIPAAHERYLMCSDGIRLAVDQTRFCTYFIYTMINAPAFRDLAANAGTGSTRKRIGLGVTTPRLLCALLHKFDSTDLSGPTPVVQGRFYVFVDECHRTQGGDMNRQMKRWLASALFIGFTGTPLLRRDKQMTRDVFGTYIHTYKFHQAVADKVVLDLKYEARDVPERLTSQKKIDEWFEQKTKNLNNFQKAIVRKRWATMEELMSAAGRKREIIADIISDFALKPRLNNNRGTAILVAASIYDACHYFQLFQNTSFGPYCGVVTSFEPNANAISKEPQNSDERYKFDTYTQHVLKDFPTTEKYETEIKRRFIEEPANTKLLIVVSKLLTGFDAPSCTYIYLDNELRDHNLFQAICRTNRLDGDDKDYGHIVDYKKLFGDVQQAIAVYSSDELDTEDGGEPGTSGDNNVRLKQWLEEGKKQLDQARQALAYLCEPVTLPRDVEQYLHYFCGDAANPNALNETEALRVTYYKAVATFARAYADLAQNLTEAGYSETESSDLKKEVEFHTEIRAAIKKHSGEELDIKPYEADMRHLINTYIQADPADALGELGEMSLTDLIIKTGIHDAIARKLNAKGKLTKNAIAEGIINNIRKTIIRDQLTDPRFYAQMSKLLDDLIKQSRVDTQAYEEFLKQAENLVKQLATKAPEDGIPASLHGRHEATVLFNNLGSIAATTFQCPQDVEAKAALALEIDLAMREHAPAGWKGDQSREAQVLNALFPLLGRDRAATLAIFEIIKNQPGYQ